MTCVSIILQIVKKMKIFKTKSKKTIKIITVFSKRDLRFRSIRLEPLVVIEISIAVWGVELLLEDCIPESPSVVRG